MKKFTLSILIFAIIFSFAGCNSPRMNIQVENGIVNVEHSQFAPEIILLGDDTLNEKDKIIENEAFFGKVIDAIDGHSVKGIDDGYPCECDIEYRVKISSDWKSGYYFLFHNHGIEIQQYCKYRKCLNLYGIVELDEAQLNELFLMLEDV